MDIPTVDWLGTGKSPSKLQKGEIRANFYVFLSTSQFLCKTSWQRAFSACSAHLQGSTRHYSPHPLWRAATLVVRILLSSWNKNKGKCPYILPGDVDGCKGRTRWVSWRACPDDIFKRYWSCTLSPKQTSKVVLILQALQYWYKMSLTEVLKIGKSTSFIC